jgi:hypothetical protein
MSYGHVEPLLDEEKRKDGNGEKLSMYLPHGLVVPGVCLGRYCRPQSFMPR